MNTRKAKNTTGRAFTMGEPTEERFNGDERGLVPRGHVRLCFPVTLALGGKELACDIIVREKQWLSQRSTVEELVRKRVEGELAEGVDASSDPYGSNPRRSRK